MDPNVRNFSQIEKFIKENPRLADAQVFEWQRFLKANAATSPELYSIETSEEFYKWAQDHPEKNIDPTVWVGKEISDAYYYLREQHENEQMRTEGKIDASALPTELLGLPLMAAAFLEKPKIMQDDRDYQKIEEKLKKEWLEKNPGKDFLSKDGIDYLHGSMEDPSRQSLAKETEESFRNNPKFKKKIERYDKENKKIYKNKESDPKWQAHQSASQEEISLRLALLGKTQDEIVKNEVAQGVQKKHQEEFATRYSEKAKAYFEKIGAEERKLEAKEGVSTAVEILSPQENPPFAPTPASTPSQVGQEQPPSPSRPLGGGINRGINTINNFARRGFSNPLGKIGSRVVVQTALRGFAAFLAGPGLPIALALGAILFFTIIIVVGLGGVPSSESNIQAPAAVPTLTPPTPSPAAP